MSRSSTLAVNIVLFIAALSALGMTFATYSRIKQACVAGPITCFDPDPSLALVSGTDATQPICVSNQSCNDDLKDYRPVYVGGGAAGVLGTAWLIHLLAAIPPLFRRRSVRPQPPGPAASS